MENEIKKIVDRILSEEIKNTSYRIKNRINEKSDMCPNCGEALYEGENCEQCGSRGDVMELGGMEDGHPKFGKKNFSKMSKIQLDRMMDMDDMDTRTPKEREMDMRDIDMEIDFEEIDEEEVEEGNEFSGELAKAREAGKKTFTVDGKTYPVKETYYRIAGQGNTLFTENEMVDIIEKMFH